jgi:hypothetical protein
LCGSSSTTSPMLCDRVPQLVTQLVVDLTLSRHSTSCQSNWLSPCARSLRLAARLLTALFHWLNCLCRASERAVFTAQLVVRSHLLYFRHAVSGNYLSPGRSGSTSTMSCDRVAQLVVRLVVDYFVYDARLGASARCAACGSSSTTSPTPRIRVPRHVARHVARLVVDYFASLGS